MLDKEHEDTVYYAQKYSQNKTWSIHQQKHDHFFPHCNADQSPAPILPVYPVEVGNGPEICILQGQLVDKGSGNFKLVVTKN